MEEVVEENKVENSVEDNNLQINAIVRFKKSLEKDMWNKRIFLRIVEASAFAGMFLCSNPLGFQVSVIIAVIALLIDILLGYQSWKQDWDFKELTL